MNRRQFLSASSLGVSIGALAACAKKSPSRAIKAISSPYFYMSPLYLAQEEGYFDKEGLKVEIEEGEGSRSSIPQLSAGNADVSFNALSPQLFNAVARGARVAIVAARQRYTQACSDQRRIYGSRKAFPNGIKDLRELRGKRVAADIRQAIGAYILDAALAAGGMTRKDIDLLNLDDREAGAMVAAGKVDVAFGVVSSLSMTSLGESVTPGPGYGDFLPEFTFSYMVFGKRLLDESREDGVRFLRAFLKASHDFVGGTTPKYLAEFARRGGLDEKKVLAICRADLSVDGQIPIKDIGTFLEWGKKADLIPSPITAEKMVDLGFLKEVASA